MMSTRLLKPCLLMSLSALLFSQPATAHIRTADLNTSRTVLEREWLEMKLELMALRLSYPAYRITLELDDESRIVFTFLASGGLAEHLSDLGPTEAKQMLAYHASGIRDRVSDLIRIEFATLWGGFDTEEDFAGRFLVPAEDWDDPPRELARWSRDRFGWNP